MFLKGKIWLSSLLCTNTLYFVIVPLEMLCYRPCEILCYRPYVNYFVIVPVNYCVIVPVKIPCYSVQYPSFLFTRYGRVPNIHPSLACNTN
jgi:hypothetical protein